MANCETIDFDINLAFENWVTVQKYEYDPLKESQSEFHFRIDSEREEFNGMVDFDWWVSELENYVDRVRVIGSTMYTLDTVKGCLREYNVVDGVNELVSTTNEWRCVSEIFPNVKYSYIYK